MEKQNNSGVFSARLESLINSALQDGVLTEQEKAILKKRADKEGEDWDEVEMIIEARLAEMNSIAPSESSSRKTVENDSDKTQDSDNSPFPKSDISALENPVFDARKEGMKDERYVKIPEGYTEIADSSFSCGKVEEIIIPDSVTHIGEEAFEYCEKLKKVVFPASLESIGDDAFNGCSKLIDLDFSRCTALKKIGTKAFCLCDKLKKIDLSKCTELHEIEDEAFSGCEKLEEITLPDSVTRIGDYAFGSCNLKKFDMPASLEEVGEYVFDKNRMDTIDFSKVKNLRVIPQNFGIFEVLMLPNGVESVEDNAFKGYNRNQKKLFLPPSLRSFGKRAGDWENIYLYAPLFDNIDNILVDYDELTLYVLPQYLEEYEGYQEALEEDSYVYILPMPDEYLYYYDN